MGNRLTSESQFKQLEFYATTNFKNFGPSQIYSLNKFPASYVIKVVSPLSQSALFHLFSQIQDHQNIYLLGLYGFRNGKLCHCTTGNLVSQSMISYWEYLSYSLKDIIQQRKFNKTMFEQSQIWHIIKVCIYGYEVFKKLKVCFDFSAQKLLINQEGRIRLDWMHIKYKNEHSNLLKKFQIQSWEIKSGQFLSPEELQALFLKQFTTKIDFQKTNVFSLGMLLLQCLLLVEPTQLLYLQNQINYARVEQLMSSHCSKYYSHNLLVLVGSMLRLNPQQRPLLEEIEQNYGKFLHSDFRIRIKKFSSGSKDIGGKLEWR